MTVTLHHRTSGTGPPLVLSPSLGTTLELWQPQLPVLERHFLVVSHDLPGHGGSQELAGPATVERFAEAVLALLDELQLGRVSFCGLSLGGMVGMALARMAPERIDRLVLACTAPYLGPPESWHERARRVRIAGTAAIAEAVLARWFTERFLAAQPVIVAAHRAMLEATPRAGYANACEAIARWDARAELDAIRARTLVIAGERDVATTPEDGATLAGSISGGALAVVPDAAHLANVEQPERFTEVLLGFLEHADRSEEAA